jgi:hypothetical protein
LNEIPPLNPSDRPFYELSWIAEFPTKLLVLHSMKGEVRSVGLVDIDRVIIEPSQNMAAFFGSLENLLGIGFDSHDGYWS